MSKRYKDIPQHVLAFQKHTQQQLEGLQDLQGDSGGDNAEIGSSSVLSSWHVPGLGEE